MFVLALGWGPNEIYLVNSRGAVAGLDLWRDLFLNELLKRFVPLKSLQGRVLKDAVESLDRGKRFVWEGYDWLEEKLLGNPATS